MSKLKIALTTGDIDGIGFEVTAKALHHLGPQRNVQFFLWRQKNVPEKYLKLIDKKWKRVTVDSLEDALKIIGSSLVDIESDLSPASWVEISAKACINKKIDGIATAPLSKTGIKEAGFKDLGHTDILKRISKTTNVNMGFIGNQFNVVLATSHIPISKVADELLNENRLSASLKNANSLRLKLTEKIKNKPIAILGLNPHAGEEGLIGADELQFYPKLKKFADKNNIPISEPLVPDAAFFPMNWKKYSVYLALYHDQGLIPFKLVHGQTSGVHISLGIPFIRTSVDHGTAKDIFGKDKANPNSMIDAIEWAVKLARL